MAGGVSRAAPGGAGGDAPGAARRPRVLGLVAIAVALGLLNAASFAPLSHWTVGLAAIAGLVALLDARAARGGGPLVQAGLAFAFGLGWFGAGLAWLYVSMHDYGGMPSAMAAAAVLLFAAYLSLYPALAVGLWARFAAPRAPHARAAALAGAWTLGELARGWVFTGFPWLAVGYAQIDGPLDALAPLLGVFGIGFAAVFAGALLAAAAAPPAMQAAGAAARGPRMRLVPLAVLGLLLALAWAAPRGAWVSPAGPPLSVRLVQGNVAQDMKFRPDRTLAAMQDYARRFVDGRAALTVLPETAWTLPWDRTPGPIAAAVAAHVARGHALAVGLPTIVPPPPGSVDPRVANSVLLMRAGVPVDPLDAAQRYDKHHLVPFGEFVPPGFRWFVDMMSIPLGDFARGAPVQPAFEVGGQRVAFNVCYEDLFGDEIRRALPGPAGATVLANVSNIAWFGNSHALPQHLAISRMRSLETGRPMLRATNTGVTAAIDAEGRVTARLPALVAGELDVVVQGTTGLTPFARWGHAPLVAIAIAGLAAGALRERTERRGRSR
jgi:apolipoprotein N-acyltransferase